MHLIPPITQYASRGFHLLHNPQAKRLIIISCRQGSRDKTIMSNDKKRKIAHRVRPIALEDVPEVLKIWASVGLCEGRNTIQSWMKLSPPTVIVSQEEEGEKKILAMCSGVKCSSNVAYIGLYATRPEYQGLGLGIEVFKAIRTELDDMNIGLGGVPAQISTYRDKAGFKNEDEHSMVVYCSPEGKGCSASNLIQNLNGIIIEEYKDVMLNELIKYDHSVVDEVRDKILELSVKEPETLILVAKENAKIIGYGMIRTSNMPQAQVGPVYGDGAQIAELIMGELVRRFDIAKKNGIYFFPFDTNKEAVNIADKLGLEEHEKVPRLYTKFVPKAHTKRIYCIFNPDFLPF